VRYRRGSVFPPTALTPVGIEGGKKGSFFPLTQPPGCGGKGIGWGGEGKEKGEVGNEASFIFLPLRPGEGGGGYKGGGEKGDNKLHTLLRLEGEGGKRKKSQKKGVALPPVIDRRGGKEV